MSIFTLEDPLAEQVKDLYSAEAQLVHALPKMAAGASDPDLAEAFAAHFEETRGHALRLEEVAAIMTDTSFTQIAEKLYETASFEDFDENSEKDDTTFPDDP